VIHNTHYIINRKTQLNKNITLNISNKKKHYIENEK